MPQQQEEESSTTALAANQFPHHRRLNLAPSTHNKAGNSNKESTAQANDEDRVSPTSVTVPPFPVTHPNYNRKSVESAPAAATEEAENNNRDSTAVTQKIVALQQKGLAVQPKIKASLSYDSHPNNTSKTNMKPNRDAELKQLRDANLATQRNQQFSALQQQAAQTTAYHEQAARDLEQRRANTRSFEYKGAVDGMTPMEALHARQKQLKEENRRAHEEASAQLRRHSDFGLYTGTARKQNLQSEDKETKAQAPPAKQEEELLEPEAYDNHESPLDALLQSAIMEDNHEGSEQNDTSTDAARRAAAQKMAKLKELESLRQKRLAHSRNKQYEHLQELSEQDRAYFLAQQRDLEARKARAASYNKNDRRASLPNLPPAEALAVYNTHYKHADRAKARQTRLEYQRHHHDGTTLMQIQSSSWDSDYAKEYNEDEAFVLRGTDRLASLTPLSQTLYDDQGKIMRFNPSQDVTETETAPAFDDFAQYQYDVPPVRRRNSRRDSAYPEPPSIDIRRLDANNVAQAGCCVIL